jgi:hypothetical protein
MTRKKIDAALFYITGVWELASSTGVCKDGIRQAFNDTTWYCSASS